MKKSTLKRCEKLTTEANKRAAALADQFSDGYEGKVLFALTIATAVMAIRAVTPGLENTANDFLSAVKAGTITWVEAGNPDK